IFMANTYKGAALIAGAAGLALAGRALLRAKRLRELEGKVVLITGGSRGLGLAMAREFAAQGCRIAICGRDEETLARARSSLAASGAEVLTLACDVTDQEDVQRLIVAVTARFGQIDVLVNNAVSITVGAVQALSVDDFHQAHDVLFWGVVYPTLAVLPQMRSRRSGHIVTITSIGGKVAVPHMVNYSSAKFAATGFTLGLRAELSGTGIKVTNIAPGTLQTGAHLHAEYVGDPQAEFTWFSRGELLPLFSMSAARTARQIVRAVADGTAERLITAPAVVMAKFAGLFPGLTADLMGLVNRGLPAVPSQPRREHGLKLNSQNSDPLLQTLTEWREGDLQGLNQFPEQPVR
ncbi:MAG: SDR family NAD(P)-dependent oxidoreductase, partial [Chloroflexaceae bacterium]|nr:SDR family NAD(P)-dependent oxidoreductase [Chloroflexaceae bacterium]